LVDELLSEKEQIEAIRGWWQENGRYIVSGVVLGIALLVGWNYWSSEKEQSAAAASALYEALTVDVANTEVEEAEAKAADLYQNYDTTVYAGQARLAMAKLYMSVGRDQDAADELAALVVGDGDGELQMIGRLRLAKVLLYQEKPQEVVDLLQGYGNTAFAARYQETLGDAYVQLGQFEAAREAYTAALVDNPQVPTVDADLVRMKLNDLPPVNFAEAEPAPAGETPAGETPAGETPVGETPAEDAPADTAAVPRAEDESAEADE
jgi:predicted negative regulator of RcsB-dependent stress response